MHKSGLIIRLTPPIMYSRVLSLSTALVAISRLTACVAAANSTFALGAFGTGISGVTYSPIYFADGKKFGSLRFIKLFRSKICIGVAYTGSGTPSGVSKIASISCKST